MKFYYDTLEIKSDASDAEIKKAFRRLAIKYHPDKNMGDEYFSNKFIEIKEAYDTLINSNLRIEYDRLLDNYLNKQTKEEKKENEEHKHRQRKTNQEREERFFYEPFKPFYSIRDREQQDTPQFNPIYDIWGKKLDESIEFFKLPKKIGKIIGGFSDLVKGEQPYTPIKKTLRIFKGIAIGLIISALIYFFGNPNQIWTVIWLVAPTGFALWLMISSNKFVHTNYYIGVNGFAKFVCTDSRTNITTEKEVNFSNITDIYFNQVEKRLNFNYQGTDYYYAFYNTIKGKLKYEAGGTFDKKEDIEKHPIELNFCRKVDQYWTIFLLDNMEKRLESNGYVLFNLYGGENKYIPYIKLGIGFITFIKDGKSEFTYKFNEIKRVYSKGSDLYVEHSNFQRTFYFFKSGNADKIPMLNLCNRQFFYKSMEILLGYKL